MSRKRADRPRQDRSERTPRHAEPTEERSAGREEGEMPRDEEGRRRVHEGTDETRGVW